MRITVQVKPNSKKPKVEKLPNDIYVVYTNVPPVDGKANQSVLKILSKELEIPISKLQIVKGHTSKHKIIEISE